MNKSQDQRRLWVYIVLGLLLLSLVGFTLFPLVDSVVRQNQSAQTSSRLQGNSTVAQLAAKASGYQQVIEREPENETALRGLLEVRLQQGDLQGATNLLEKVAALKPQQTGYSILLAQAKAQLGDYEGAKEAYRQALASQPGDLEALQGLVNLLLQQGQSEEAIAAVQAALEAAKADPSVGRENLTSMQLLLGVVYTNLQRYSEAIAVYDQLIDAQAADFRPVLAKALVLQEQGKGAEAQPLFEQAVTLAPAEYREQITVIAASESEPVLSSDSQN